jgi:GNAT superfamily N-acetyltransferase
MPTAVRAADLQRDRDALIEFLALHLNPAADANRFDWLYLQNPHGPARCWVSTDAPNGKIVGASTIFPRRMLRGDGAIRGCVFGDFCIHPDYRSLGPAVQLQRATLAGMQDAGFEFGYDFPSASMLGVYHRLGIRPQDLFVRMAKPLRANRQIGARVKSRIAARGASAVANAVLSSRDVLLRPSGIAEIELHEGPCGEEFTALAKRVGASLGNCIERSADYLNWRFMKHPHQTYEMLTAHVDGVLAGYLVAGSEETGARIVDWFGAAPESVTKTNVAKASAAKASLANAKAAEHVRRDLMIAAINHLREMDFETISFPLLASSPWLRELEGLGFRGRESRPVMMIEGPGAEVASRSWLLFDGDRES